MKDDKELEGKSFFQKWKIGMKRISAVQMQQVKVTTHICTASAFLAVSITFFYFVDWSNVFTKEGLSGIGWSILILFMCFLQIIEAVNAYKKKEELREELEMNEVC